MVHWLSILILGEGSKDADPDESSRAKVAILGDEGNVSVPSISNGTLPIEELKAAASWALFVRVAVDRRNADSKNI